MHCKKKLYYTKIQIYEFKLQSKVINLFAKTKYQYQIVNILVKKKKTNSHFMFY
jgi:hypothetical protein